MALVINRALQNRPSDGSTHWSPRTLTTPTEIARTLLIHGCSPFQTSRTGRSSIAAWKLEGYKLSSDLFFVEKIRDIVGL